MGAKLAKLAGLAAILALCLPLSEGDAAEPAKSPLPRCERGTSFKTVAWLGRHAKPGRVAVRGRLWRSPSAVCTASFPPACTIFFALGPRAPREDEVKGFVSLDGELDGARFACQRVGDGPVSCPVEAKGEELGVEGMLTVEEGEPAPRLFLNVEKVCRP
jgi:hypothetical protein